MRHYFRGSIDGPPPPFNIARSMYQVMAAEWVVLDTYLTRDINTIDWRLQGSGGNALKTTTDFERNLNTLFFMRRRITRYLVLIKEQLESCQSRGTRSWDREYTEIPNHERELLRVSEDLILDYSLIESLMSRSLNRVEQNIGHITSLSSTLQSNLGVREAERGVQQNKLVLLLAVVATFFLPISTMSTILSMNGDWAPLGPKFWQFWLISISLSLILVSLLVVSRSWSQIMNLVGRLGWGMRRNSRIETLAE
jgi:Mg2+ and Co2+ transporter CorA